MKPFLSIITVCRNAEVGLRKTAASVLEHRQAFEWIVVDGGSSDGSVEFLKGISDERLYFISQSDDGIYDAMNCGAKLAKGEFVWFLNAGDVVANAEAMERLEHVERDVDIIFGDVGMIGADGHLLGRRSEVLPHSFPETLKYKEFAMGMLVSHQAFIIRSSLMVPYNLNYRLSSDLDWMLRILKQSKSSVDLGLLALVEFDGATQQNWVRSQFERFCILSAHFGFRRTLLRHIRILIRRISHGRRTGMWR